MSNSCTTCPRTLTPAEADRYACQACTYRLRSWLTELPAELPELRAQLLPAGRPAQGTIGGGSAHSPAPLRLDVLDLLGPGAPVLDDPHGDQTGGLPITALLYGWARYIAGEHPSVRVDEHGTQRIGPCDSAVSRHGTTAEAWCSWLTAYLPYAVTRPWIRELYRALEDLLYRVRHITQSQIRTLSMRAPCPLCGAFALVARDGEWFIECEACPEVLDREYYAEYEAEVLPQLMRTALTMLAAQGLAEKEAADHA